MHIMGNSEILPRYWLYLIDFLCFKVYSDLHSDNGKTMTWDVDVLILQMQQQYCNLRKHLNTFIHSWEKSLMFQYTKTKTHM